MISRRIARSVVVPAALVMAVSGSTVAFAGEPSTYYTMRLNPANPHLVPGRSTTVRITFRAGHRLDGVPVDLSTTGLPSGVTVRFDPATPRIGERATMTLITSVGVPAARVTASVSALTESSDPIGTTTPMVLTIG